MKTIFEAATNEVGPMLTEVVERYHPHLQDLEVRVGIMFAIGMDKEDQVVPCLKKNRVFTPGQIHLITGKNRVFNPNDCEILLDKCFWDGSADATRKALLDHELEHVKPQTDRHGMVQHDDHNRVKLQLIPDDFTINGFLAVVRRHGPAAVESGSVQGVASQVNEILSAFQEGARRLNEIVNGGPPVAQATPIEPVPQSDTPPPVEPAAVPPRRRPRRSQPAPATDDPDDHSAPL